MRIPVIHGLIERRILLSYRIDPEIAARRLPQPFEPLIVRGYAVGGICLIRLSRVRPAFWPGRLGLTSENAAHRFAVTWSGEDGPGEGVYIPRRDTSSRTNTLLGGRLFPGVHHHAQFHVRESTDRWEVSMSSDDTRTNVAVAASAATRLNSALFDDTAAAARFFQLGSRGYSPGSSAKSFEGLELSCDRWEASPLAASEVRSSYFDDPAIFPPGLIEFDCALLMRGIPHRWLGLGTLTSADDRQPLANACP